MKCPYCEHTTTEVVETRDNEDLSVTRRRRQCSDCDKRFTTYERIESVPLTVIKRDKRRESFDRDKLIRGVMQACEKTTVSHADIVRIVDWVERELRTGDSVEIASDQIGKMVAEQLKKKDKVAYIRFSSVFRRFVDVEEFERELKKLL